MNNFYQNQGNPELQKGGFGEEPQIQNISAQEGGKDEFLQEAAGNNTHASLHKASIPHNEVTSEMKRTYEEIFDSYGVDAANNWLKQQIVNNHINLQAENEAVLREVQAKHAEIYSIPAVQQAISAYISMDLNPSISLREQGFQDAMEHVAGIYKAGYEAAMGLKAQNDSAKARMASAVNSSMPNYQSNRVFTRAEIKAMSPEEFARNEKVIFEQLNRGFIK